MGLAAEPTTDLAQTMAERIMGTTSHAEALRTLRTAFPESSLAQRVAVLATLTRRAPRRSILCPLRHATFIAIIYQDLPAHRT